MPKPISITLSDSQSIFAGCYDIANRLKDVANENAPIDIIIQSGNHEKMRAMAAVITTGLSMSFDPNTMIAGRTRINIDEPSSGKLVMRITPQPDGTLPAYAVLKKLEELQQYLFPPANRTSKTQIDFGDGKLREYYAMGFATPELADNVTLTLTYLMQAYRIPFNKSNPSMALKKDFKSEDFNGTLLVIRPDVYDRLAAIEKAPVRGMPPRGG